MAEYCGFEYDRVFPSGNRIYVLYSTDGLADSDPYSEMPCSGGSGTGLTHFAELIITNGHLRLINADILETVSKQGHDINTRFIDQHKACLFLMVFGLSKIMNSAKTQKPVKRIPTVVQVIYI